MRTWGSAFGNRAKVNAAFAAEQLHQHFGLTGDLLCECWILGSELLDQRLNERRILCHQFPQLLYGRSSTQGLDINRTASGGTSTPCTSTTLSLMLLLLSELQKVA